LLALNCHQNYDLSVSEAPKLFSDAEFEAVKRIEAGLKVLVLRKRLQVGMADKEGLFDREPSSHFSDRADDGRSPTWLHVILVWQSPVCSVV